MFKNEVTMNRSARNFAKFASRSTPKHSLRAFASVSTPRTFQFSKPSIAALSSVLLPIPPALLSLGAKLPKVSTQPLLLVDGCSETEVSSLAESLDALDTTLSPSPLQNLTIGLSRYAGISIPGSYYRFMVHWS